MKRKELWIFTLLNVFLCLGIIFGISTNVRAGSGIYYLDDDALPIAPKGIPVGELGDNDLFKYGVGTNGGKPQIYSENNSVILLIKQGDTPGVSSVWSNKENDNYIDITKKQILTAWLYFGRHRASTEHGSEGMVLVLQNSGYDAIARTKVVDINNNYDYVADVNSDAAGGESIGVWGSDQLIKTGENVIFGDIYDPGALKNTTQIMANSALQKSFALEFDTHRNGQEGSPATGTNGDAFDAYQNRSMPLQHAAYGYPASKDTYKSIGSNSHFTASGILHTGNTTFPYYLMNHKGIEEQDLDNNNKVEDAWHHITVTYRPKTSTSGPTLTYALNDKLIDGRSRGSTGQTPYTNTVDLDMSQFGDISDNKLYYGFTGATSVLGDSNTEAIVFETMPSLVEMEANAYIVDKSTNSKISDSTDIMDDEALKLDDTEKAHPGDDLKFNYLLQYESGKQQSKDVTAMIEMPDGVTVSSDNNIGKIYYDGIDNSTGNPTTKSVDISKDSYDSTTKKINVAIEDMGKTGDDDIYWKTARIELDTTANDIPDGQTQLTVPVGHASIEGTNYVTDIETPQFDIVKPADTLVLNKVSGDGSYNLNDAINLKGTMEYGSKKTLDPAEITLIYQIDNESEQHAVETGQAASEKVNFNIPLSGLSEGEHTVTVKAVSKADEDVISSNLLTYDLNITDRELIVTPDDTSRVVDDNGIQTITGTLKFSDNSRIDILNTTQGYLTDGKGNEQDPVDMDGAGAKYDYNGDRTEVRYTYTVKPIGYDETGIVNSKGTSGLTVGKNNYKILFDAAAEKVDGSVIENYKTTTEYIIDVPDLKIDLSNDGQDSITAMNGQDIKFPSTVSYSDASYKYGPRFMTAIGKIDGLDSSVCIANDYADSSNVTGDYTINNGLQIPDNFDDNKEEYTAEYYVLDPYLRKSNTINYNVDVITKYVKLTTGKNYSFGQHVVDPEIDGYTERSGDWQLSVDSVMSPWKLTASATKFIRDNDTGGDADVLDGNMIFVDPHNDNISSLSTGEDGDPVEIAEQESASTGITNISNSWDNDNGILLDMDSAAIKGIYTSTISWNLTDSL